MAQKPIKVMVAKASLDQDGKEARILARALKDQGGMDVIYTGLYRSLEEIAEQSLQEDVNIVLLLIHTSAPMDIYPPLRRELDQRGGENIVLTAGGHIPRVNKEALLKTGVVKKVFDYGTSAAGIIDWIHRELKV